MRVSKIMSYSSGLIWKKRETFSFTEILTKIFLLKIFGGCIHFFPKLTSSGTYILMSSSFYLGSQLQTMFSFHFTHIHLVLTFMYLSLAFFSISKSTWYWNNLLTQLPTFQFSSVVSDSLRLHGQQHTRPPCSSPAPKVYSNSHPLSQWCHLTNSSTVIPFSCLQSFPASVSLPMSQFFASGVQSLEFQIQHQSFQWISRTDFL